jgi:hypothetical protein
MKISVRLITFALCFGFFIFAHQMQAAEIEEVIFQDKIIIENVEFLLRGVALQKYMLFFKGFVGALYLPTQINPADAMGDLPKHLVLQYFHDIKKEDFQESTISIIKKNVSEASYEKIADRVQKLNKLYQDVKSGERYSLTYIQGTGSTLSLNGKPLGTIPGYDFSFAVFSIWLGENPIGENFRDVLLGKK